MNDFYVYVYLDPRKPGQYKYGKFLFDHEPFYVGKGIGKRYSHHLIEAEKTETSNYKLNKIRKICENGTIPIIEFPLISLSEVEAYNKEIELITSIGRLDLQTGPLVNLTAGGDGLRDPSGEIREKIRNAHLGKVLTEEHKEKIKESNLKFDETNIRWPKDKREKLSKTLKCRDITWGNKISDALCGKELSDSHKQHLSESRIGHKNHQWKNVDLKELFRLRFEDRLTIKAIAEQMHISVSTVKRKLKDNVK